MNRRLTREEASRVLGVSASADAHEVKRSYRRLVLRHHPDAGGDQATFQELQRAYERLAEPASHAPVVGRGRPSRPTVPFVEERRHVDAAAVDWSAAVPGDGEHLDVDRLAVMLVSSGDQRITRVSATSRAPGSRLNALAHHLAGELTSRLVVSEAADDRGRPVVSLEVVGATRRARRAIDGTRTGDGWIRVRRSSSSVLRRTIPRTSDVRLTAARAATLLDEALDRLDWPLEQWRAVVAAGGDRVDG